MFATLTHLDAVVHKRRLRLRGERRGESVAGGVGVGEKAADLRHKAIGRQKAIASPVTTTYVCV
jgi:hypothetical protein